MNQNQQQPNSSISSSTTNEIQTAIPSTLNLERSPSFVTRSTKNHQHHRRSNSNSLSTSNTSINILPPSTSQRAKNTSLNPYRTTSDQIEDQSITGCCFVGSIRSDRKKTLSACLLALCSLYFCSFITTIVEERLPNPKDFPPLPDLLLDNVKYIPWAFSVTGTIIAIETATLIVIIILHRHRLIIIRRLFLMVAALYCLRSLTLIFTSLPVTTKMSNCRPERLSGFAARLKKATLIFLSHGMLSFGVKTCDSSRSYHLLHFLSWILALTGMFFILAGHQNYSTAILVAWVLSSRLFIYYHTFANNQAYLQRDKARMKIWFPFFSYFEKNVKQAIPNEYCLPDSIYQAFIEVKDFICAITLEALFAVLCAVLSLIMGALFLSFSYVIDKNDNQIQADTFALIIVAMIIWHIILPITSWFLIFKRHPHIFRHPYLEVLSFFRSLRRKSSVQSVQDDESFYAQNSPTSSADQMSNDDNVQYSKHTSFKFDPIRFHFRFMIIVGSFGQTLATIVGAIYRVASNFSNETAMNETAMNNTFMKPLIWIGLATYLYNLIPLSLALYYVLDIYMSIVKKSDKISSTFLKSDREIDSGRTELKQWADAIFDLNEKSEERKHLLWANKYASAYVTFYLFWAAVCCWYIFATKNYKRIDLYIIAGGHFLAFIILIVFMWRTNVVLDYMKKIILHVHLRRKNLVKELYGLSALLESLKPYASLFTVPVSFPAVCIAGATVILQNMTPLIKKRLNLGIN
ncbi:unnamed protein product [Rotaria magnacalcarata]|uniref:Sphingomyelin synthase-like domain-containing protein n=2 Tax=Rotaria magnacalcarata TaxID=392030 RepID=A0A816Q4I5_9BILA|nr:unnamed protein product [Rotaria magnacalcarata]